MENPKKNSPECPKHFKPLIDVFVEGVLHNIESSGTLTSIPKCDIQDLVKLARVKTEEGIRGNIRDMAPGFTGLERDHFEAMGVDPAKFDSAAIRRLRKQMGSFARSNQSYIKKIADEFDIRLNQKQEREILEAAWTPLGEKVELHGKFETVIPMLSNFQRYLSWAKQHYNSLLRNLEKDPHLPGGTRRRISIEIGVVLGVLQAFSSDVGYDPEKAQRWARQKLGYNMPGAALQKQKFWNAKIKRLVDIVNPLCEPKRGEWDKGTPVRKRAYQFTARLLHECYPEVWADRPDLIKSRYDRGRV